MSTLLRYPICRILLCNQIRATSITVTRGRKQWEVPLLKELYRRRQAQGPEPERPRSELQNWNYDAEIFSFGKRLGEDFSDSTLRQAVTHSSYITKEMEKREGLELDETEVSLDLKDNSELRDKGKEFTSWYIKTYLRRSLPLLPEEGITAIQNFLTKPETLADIGSKLGIKDLVLCEEFPPSAVILSDSLFAVIGGLFHDQGEEKCGHFVKDFILTSLVGRDIGAIWEIVNPMGLLTGILENQNRGQPEPRLMWQSGCETVEAVYMVGVYSDKELVGYSPGETVTIAEEMAARDALKRIIGITDNRTPFKFHKKESLQGAKNSPNPSILDYDQVNVLQ